METWRAGSQPLAQDFTLFRKRPLSGGRVEQTDPEPAGEGIGRFAAVETRGSNGELMRFGVVGRTAVPADGNEDAFENVVATRLLSVEGLHIVA